MDSRMYSFKRLLALSAMGLLLVPAGAALADTTGPDPVDNVEAFPGDGQITVSWDPATDDTGVEGYYMYSGLTSVTENGGSYTFGSTDVGDTTTYVMEGLSNGVTYYFAITAYDAAGNESEYYSYEASATPEESEVGDFTAPTVTGAEAITSTLVEVEFSEEVELPTDGASAFSIESTGGEALSVIDAYLSDDASVVFVVTDTQDEDSEYILTAGIAISDESGNPIVSGTSDTAVFSGSSLIQDSDDEEESDDSSSDSSSDTSDEAADEDSASADFYVSEVEASSTNELTLTFSQAVGDADPDAFSIQQADDASEEVLVLGVSVSDDDATHVSLLTEDMDSGVDYILSIGDDVNNTDGETVSDDERSVEFTSKTLDLSDLIAPEDITDLLAEVSDSDETSVLLSWTASVDSAGDLAEYLVYQSSDDGSTYTDAGEVDADTTEYEVDGLTAGETYTFKVTAVDENGNESEGVITSVTLPESGPAAMAMLGLSLAGAGALTRRRRNG